MSKRDDLTGRRFAYLVAEEFTGTDSRGRALWLCRCDCGNTRIITGSKLKVGEYKSCGCMHYKYGHGQTNTRLYHIWRTMKARCEDPNSHKYHAYGGRGITVCEEWLNSFESFYDWATASGYRDDLSIDRINNDGNYCPENCRWATAKEQANNTRRNRLLTYNGETHTVAEWAKIVGITKTALYHRLSRGWSVKEALITPMLQDAR